MEKYADNRMMSTFFVAFEAIQLIPRSPPKENLCLLYSYNVNSFFAKTKTEVWVDYAKT